MVGTDAIAKMSAPVRHGRSAAMSDISTSWPALVIVIIVTSTHHHMHDLPLQTHCLSDKENKLLWMKIWCLPCFNIPSAENTIQCQCPSYLLNNATPMLAPVFNYCVFNLTSVPSSLSVAFSLLDLTFVNSLNLHNISYTGHFKGSWPRKHALNLAYSSIWTILLRCSPFSYLVISI